MIQVKDLKLKEEVFPFFNYTNNNYASDRLYFFIKDVPATKSEVINRQDIIKGFSENWYILKGFTYRKLDFLEVHALFEAIINKKNSIGDSEFKSSLKLMFFESDRNSIKSKFVQMVYFLNDLQKHYLLKIDKTKFPENFKTQLQQSLIFLNKLNLESMENLIVANKLSALKLVAFHQRLHQISPDEITAFWDFLFSFEAYWSIAKSTVANNLSFPCFAQVKLLIKGFYHPAIKNPVTNDLEFNDSQNVLLLTGPNMSGKSTLLKALGLCVYLAHVGFPVPAVACEIPFFNSIAIAINLSDNLQDGYSHFMAEVKNLKAVIVAAEGGQKCFAVFDEIFRGTNIDDALDITTTTVNGLSKKTGSFSFISTHMLDLNMHLHPESVRNVKKCYIECILDEGSPKFSYKLKEGCSQLKIGKILFEKEGLSELLS